MRVLFGIAVSMVHPVHDAVRPGVQKRGSLKEPGTEIKEFLPERVRVEHFMRCVPVKEKGLKKQGYKPVYQKKIQYYHDSFIIIQTAQR